MDSNIPQEEIPIKKEMIYSLLGKEYSLPSEYQKLKTDGWILEDNPSFILEGNKFIGKRFLRNGPHVLEVSFYNPEEEPSTLEESLISKIAAENRTFGSDIASDIKIMDRINFSTPIEEIIEDLGSYEVEESALFKTYIFEHDLLSKTEIRINVETNEIRWIIIENYKVD